MVFLRQVVGIKARNMGVNTWRKKGAERVLQPTGTKHFLGYMERRQAMVAEWVALHPMIEVYEGEGREVNSTKMSHIGHHGWQRFPSSIITTFSWTCRCQKCIHIVVRVAAQPLHPSTGQGIGPSFSGNVIL